jgi:ElaB/YqjD/DUF883 family membrane-anchored ribosome-binding protein
MFRIRNLAALAFMSLLMLAGCEQEGPAERAGERLDDALSNAQDRLEDARDEVEETAEDVREALSGE